MNYFCNNLSLGKIANCALLVFFLTLNVACTAENDVRKIPLVFNSTSHQFKVELAANDEQRVRGLMFREELNDNAGMLFLFSDEIPRSFWMKNTLISLDIIYLDEYKRIVSIAKRAKPLDETSLPSIFPAQYVLEIRGGLSDELGIKNGDMALFTLPVDFVIE